MVQRTNIFRARFWYAHRLSLKPESVDSHSSTTFGSPLLIPLRHVPSRWLYSLFCYLYNVKYCCITIMSLNELCECAHINCLVFLPLSHYFLRQGSKHRVGNVTS